PPMVAGAARIRVTYQVDADGLLSVTARETHSGVEASVTVKPSYGLADDDIARMLQESFREAEHDMKSRALAEERVEADRLVEATQRALETDGDLLSAEERTAVEALMATVREIATGEDHHAIHAAVEKLSHGTDEFAARRMDRSIKSALAGRKVQELG
ncbi:Hsp70 family protein, partial [Cupriavidus necator]